ncbi:MAG: CpaD family pilus assembly protein [Pseudomonadota bacterium]
MRQTTQRRKKQAALFAAAFFSLGLSGCAGYLDRPFSTSYGEMPPNYESRHPVELTASTASTVVNLSVAGAKINGLERQQIESFGRAFRVDGEGAMAIGIPVGAPNERQAANLARDARQILIAQGLPTRSIVYRPYKAGPGTEAPPMLLSYRRLRANVPNSCGAIENLDIDWKNQQWQDFGCASQNNFAAQLAEPNDLMGPRPMDNPSAARRAKTLQDYTSNGNKALTGGSSTSGGGSSSGN